MIPKVSDKIDFVLTWVDGSDLAWQRKRDQFANATDRRRKDVAGDQRYNDNGLLRFWFRAVDHFAPWVNRVFLVTDHQLPTWIDAASPKLRIVCHEDFIPARFLPTFNSNVILLHVPFIEELSEHFVLFNDDMFLTAPCHPSDFFKNGLPRDLGVLEFLSSRTREVFFHELFNNICVINKLFSKSTLNKRLFFSPKIGIRNIVKNGLLWSYKTIPGFYDPHLPVSYRKSFCRSLFPSIKDEVELTGSHRFRSSDDLTEWVYRYAQLAAGIYSPRNRDKDGIYCTMANPSIPSWITSRRYKILCINDESPECYPNVEAAFSKVLSNKSSFESI